MNSIQLLNRLYPATIKRRRYWALFSRTAFWTRKNALNMFIIGLLFIFWAVAHLYYYNKLVDLEYNVQEAWAQVESQWQRRYNIQQNMTLLVGEYAKHEQGLLLSLTAMRTNQDPASRGTSGQATAKKSAPPGPAALDPAQNGNRPGAEQLGEKITGNNTSLAEMLQDIDPQQLNALYPQIRLVAEQYPQLRLSENFQQFSTAIIETENKIAEQIMRYNTSVNIYTTTLQQFPGNIFGTVCGFKPYRFYAPDKDAMKFRMVHQMVKG